MGHTSLRWLHVACGLYFGDPTFSLGTCVVWCVLVLFFHDSFWPCVFYTLHLISVFVFSFVAPVTGTGLCGRVVSTADSTLGLLVHWWGSSKTMLELINYGDHLQYVQKQIKKKKKSAILKIFRFSEKTNVFFQNSHCNRQLFCTTFYLFYKINKFWSSNFSCD